MVGIYFSGTGNTRHCIEQFVNKYDESASILSIEDSSVIQAIKDNDFIVFAYPIYYSNLPKIVRDFIEDNKKLFRDKKIYIIATMALFSGDGAGCCARIFRKYGVNVIGGLHLKMPDCICDVKLLKNSLEINKRVVTDAEKKINKAVNDLKESKPKQEGLNVIYHCAGLFGQRLWFYNKTKKYTDQLKINPLKCIGCGICSKECPMNNLELENAIVRTKGLCTMCYRCISNCPKQAITLIGKEVYEQCKIERYI